MTKSAGTPTLVKMRRFMTKKIILATLFVFAAAFSGYTQDSQKKEPSVLEWFIEQIEKRKNENKVHPVGDFSEFLGEENKETKYVCSKQGISVWTEPSFDSEKIGGLYKLQQAVVYGYGHEVFKVNGVENRWNFIKYGDGFGWVLGHFLADSLEEAKSVLDLEGQWMGDEIVSDRSEKPGKGTSSIHGREVIVNFDGIELDKDGKKNKPLYSAVFFISGEKMHSVENSNLTYEYVYFADMGFGGSEYHVLLEDGVLYGLVSNRQGRPTDEGGIEWSLHENFTFSFKKIPQKR